MRENKSQQLYEKHFFMQRKQGHALLQREM